MDRPQSAPMERQRSFDVLKAACAFLVICIHCPFPGQLGVYIVSLARVAVPLFFMITGYFYQNTADRHKESKQIKKVLVLILQANVIFLLYQALIPILTGGDIPASLQGFFTLNALIKFVAVNESPFAGHLWYLNAIFYVLVIVYLADKRGIRKILYIATPFLLLGDLVFGKYSIVLFGREFPYILVRNFLFVGIPYFCIGCILYERRARILKIAMSRKTLLLCILLFSMTTIAERYLLVTLGANAARDHYLSTTFLSVMLFVLAMYLSSKPQKTSAFTNYIAHVGRDDSTWVYILHPLIIGAFGYLFKRIGMEGPCQYLAPILVWLSSIALAAMFRRVLRAGRQRKRIAV